MRVEYGRLLRRLPPHRRLALFVQLLLLLAGGAALLWAAAPGGWLLALLLASTLNLAAAVAWRRRRGTPGGRGALGATGQGAMRREAWHPGEEDEPAPGGDEPWRRRLQSLEDDLARGERRLDRVLAGRERAREESRLKSDYLTLLARELTPLLERLDALSREAGEGVGERHALGELRERLGDLAALLEVISGEAPRASVAALPARQPARVLIVDDGPVNLMLARQVLERQGLDVRTATSGAEALACLEQLPFDLVLMDIFMPGMDGMETSRRWRDLEASRHPGHHSVLVALTANASAEDRRRFEAAGLDDYLAKPYRPQALIERVRHWLPERLDAPQTP